MSFSETTRASAPPRPSSCCPSCQRGQRPPPPSEANLCLSPSPPLRGCSLLRAPVSGSSRSAPQPAVLFVRLLSPGAPGFSLDQSAPRFLPEFHSVLIPSQEESGLDHAWETLAGNRGPAEAAVASLRPPLGAAAPLLARLLLSLWNPCPLSRPPSRK